MKWLKNIFRRILCVHERIVPYRRVSITEWRVGQGPEAEGTIELRVWSRCISCGAGVFWKKSTPAVPAAVGDQSVEKPTTTP